MNLICKMKKLLVILIIFLSCRLLAQDITPAYVQRTFESMTLVNTQTTELTPNKGFEFNIQHRFGVVDVEKKPLHDFVGLDLTSNIRFGFAFSVGNRLTVGFGRTKFDKVFDFDIKYLLLRQTKNFKVPVNVAVYGSMGIMSDDFPTLQTEDFYYYYGDSATEFSYKFSHRVTYLGQILISSKITRWFSVMAAPTFAYRNLVEPGDVNHRIAIPLGAKFKTGFMTSVLLEWSPVVNRPDEYHNPISLAFEIRPVGHVFQVVISNSQQIPGQDLYTRNEHNVNPWEGKFYLGFNLHRNLYYSRKK